MKEKSYSKIRENLQACLIAFVLLFEIFNYVNLNNQVEQIRRELNMLKDRQATKPGRKGDLAKKFNDDCCFKYLTHDRYKRFLSSERSSVSGTLSQCEKGDKGAKGTRGPPGLPGMKGEIGGCGCFTTREPETAPPPTIEPRQYECKIHTIGIPLHQADEDTYWGFWSKDAFKYSPFHKYYWVTKHFEGRFLYAFESQEEMKASTPHLIFDLSPDYYFGTGHVVFNGSFIYHAAGSKKLNKFDLETKEVTASVTLSQATFISNNYLYSSSHTYFDLAVDENGLWVTYGSTVGDLMVSNLDPNDLRVRVTWNIPAKSKEFGESFLTCGCLHLIRNTTTKTTKVDAVYDLYTEEWLETNLKFRNPYELNVMVSYNPVDKKIYSWDRGHLLIYPLLLE